MTSQVASTRLRHAAWALDSLADAPEVRILVPTNGAGNDLPREYLLGRPDARGRMGLHRATVLGLARQLAAVRLAEAGKIPLGGVGIDALVCRVAGLCSSNRELEYFDSVSGTPGFSRALGRTLAEVRLAGVGQQELTALGASGRDLSRLLGRYLAELDATGLADPAEVLDVARRCVSDPGASRLPLLMLDVWPQCRAEEQFLEALIGNAGWVTAILLPQVEPGLQILSRLLGQNPETLPEQTDHTSLNRLRKYVFTLESPERAEPDSSVRFFSATNEGREAVEIARYIQIAAAGGSKFDRIAILLRNPGTYQPLIEDALGRAGVPGHFTHGSLRPNPAGRAFLALLASASERLSAARFAEYLSLGQTPPIGPVGSATRPPAPDPPAATASWVGAEGELFPPLVEVEGVDRVGDVGTEGAEPTQTDPRAPFHWERLLGEAAVIGGRDRWARRLSGLRGEMAARARETGRSDDAHRAYLDRQIEYLDELERFALPLVDRLASLPGAAPWGEWLEHLEALAVAALRHPAQVLAVLAELRPMADIGPVTPDDVQRVLTERLGFLRNEPVERRYGKVFVGTIPEAAGRSFDLVFLPGMAEGVFPRKSLEDPLLPDDCRAFGDRSMTRQSDRSRKERLLLHLAAGSAERALFVSYPRMDIRQGRARVPSFYALDILRAVEGQIPNLADLERKATGASMSRLGWPSPVDPGVAIDDAEYDLATIGMLTGAQLGSDTTGGQGHYLIGANPCLARSLRTRAKRWRKVWSGADGIVDPDTETLRVLADERPTARSYSATALETFASCPYRFLLHAIHRLHPMEDVAAIEQIDPLTRGGLFHTIQFRVLTDLGASGLLPVTPANHGEVRKRADTVLDAVAVESYERLAPAIDRIWDNEIEDLRTDLRGWIRQQAMAGRDATEWKPAYFEFGFGMTVSGDHDPASTTDEAVVFGDIRLRGSIDLVETHTRNDVLRITDHKTGRAPARPVDTTGGGEVLQPILYAAAAEALLERPVATSGLSYCTERGEYRRVDIHVDDRSRDAGEEAVRLIDQSIKEGFLPASPREGACAMCDFKAVCGPYEERRTALKRPSDHHEQVDRLRRLRRQ